MCASNRAIPIGNKNNASEWYGGFEVRDDLLDEVGMNGISTIEDLEALRGDGGFWVLPYSSGLFLSRFRALFCATAMLVHG